MAKSSNFESQVKSISAAQAWEIMEQNPRAVIIDVRSGMENLFVGHPKDAIHIAWIDEPDWKINPHFAQEVRRVLLGGVSPHDGGVSPILLICRSGNRSLEAGAVLVEDGLTDVYNIEGGFEGPLDDDHHRSTVTGWRKEGLPWVQC